jgi:tetratricopeptide (TPR) repeat protein/2-polyprenyl-3-methyl-5-hydroxy-6-metoxy-1,4-benzoquinol methylase
MSEQNTPKTHGQSQLTVDEAYKQAVSHFNAERYTEADQHCTAIIKAAPNHIWAIDLLGLIAQKYNRHDIAIKQFQHAINIDNSRSWLYKNLGTSLYTLGKNDEAIQSLRTALLKEPENSQIKDYLDSIIQSSTDTLESHNSKNKAKDAMLKGVSYYQSGDMDKALQWYKKCLSIQPENIAALSNMGLVLHTKDRLEEAITIYQKAIAIQPDFENSHYNLGNALKDQGKLEEAVTSYQKAISIKPDYAEAYSNLGNTLKDLRKLEEAVTCYQKAISIKPDLAKTYSNLANTLKEQGKLEEAAANHQKAILMHPENGTYWAGLAQCVKVMNFSHWNEEFFHYLLQMLDQSTVSPQSVSAAVIKALRHHPKFSHVLGATEFGNIEKKFGYLTTQLSAIPLLLRIMELSVIADIGVEKMLTQMRNVMLNNISTKNIESQSLPFYAALALHCFTNEYVYTEKEEEIQKVKHLQEEIKSILDNGNSVPPAWIAVLGAYRPLHIYTWSVKLLEFEWSPDMEKVIERQIKEPREEQVIRSQIPCLDSIKDTVSKTVRYQYEINPYPRWVSTSLCNKPKTIKQSMQEIKLNQDFNKQKFADNPEILVAGCGTGQHSLITASRYSNCKVLAFDLSLSSLSYAKRKTDELCVSNIEFLQGDILQLKDLHRQFDIIESVGVLHHMNDPIAGWKILVDILKPNGLMKIGLYSNIARQNIVEARKLIAEKKYTSSPKDIRQFRSAIINMKDDANSKITRVLQTIDFYSISTRSPQISLVNNS